MLDRTLQQLGNYRLLRSIGHGGFADVYLGQHIYLNTYAAIKVLQTKLIQNDLQIFLTEARTIASLSHANIVRVLEFGVEIDTPFLVMDYSPNGTLRQRHPKGTHLSLPECVPYIKQVATALQYAHDQRVIHRDVKPENMLIGRNGEILLSDFGIAVVSQSSRYQGHQEVGGTVAYMAPEQLQGKATSASDQYALGIVLYEWLSGNLPFKGSFAEIGSQHLFTPPPPLSMQVPTMSSGVEQVIMRALAKDPQQRFSSISEFANILEQASQGADQPLATFANAPTVKDQENISTYVKPISGNSPSLASRDSANFPAYPALDQNHKSGPVPTPSQTTTPDFQAPQTPGNVIPQAPGNPMPQTPTLRPAPTPGAYPMPDFWATPPPAQSDPTRQAPPMRTAPAPGSYPPPPPGMYTAQPVIVPQSARPRSNTGYVIVIALLLILLIGGAWTWSQQVGNKPGSATSATDTQSGNNASGGTTANQNNAPVATVAAGTISVDKSKGQLTCTGCNNPIVTTITSITFDPTMQRVVFEITLYNTTGLSQHFQFNDFSLHDNQSNNYPGTGSILASHWYAYLAAGQSIPVEAVFSFNPLKGETYKLTTQYGYFNSSDYKNVYNGTYNGVNRVTLDPMQFKW